MVIQYPWHWRIKTCIKCLFIEREILGQSLYCAIYAIYNGGMQQGRPKSGYTAPQIIANNLSFSNIRDINSGLVKLFATLDPPQQKGTSKPHLKLYETIASDTTGSIRVVWFNIKSSLYLDTSKQYVLMGRVDGSRSPKTLINPVMTSFDDYNKWEKKLNKR